MRRILPSASIALAFFIQLFSSACAQPSEETNSDVPLHGAGEYIETDDGRLYYETEGSGPPVILVAGGPGSGHASFHRWFTRLTDRFTVVYFDNIGRGRSDRLSDPSRYTVERDAKDIEALRKALGFDRMTLIGHSYGGMPALAYAVRYPDRLTHLILSDTIHSGDGWQQNIDSANNIARIQYPENWRALMTMREEGVLSSEERYADLYGQSLGDLYWHDADKRVLQFRPEGSEDAFNGDVYAAILGDDPEWEVKGPMAGFDPREKLKTLDIPVLVAVGRYDRVATPKIALELAEAFGEGHAEFAVFEQSAHRPWIEEADAYFDRLSAFLQE